MSSLDTVWLVYKNIWDAIYGMLLIATDNFDSSISLEAYYGNLASCLEQYM